MTGRTGAILAALVLTGCTALQPATRVGLDSGRVEGLALDGVVAFRGIPYAAPPVGALRWRSPAPVAPWTGVREARRYAPACRQPESALMRLPPGGTSEDCLTLNVLAPTGRAGPLPVMVWIHGGGYVQGTGNDPVVNSPALAREGVVLVTVNYRLNLFGFMAHPAVVAGAPGEPAGNYGLQDVVAALGWVRRNAAAFGGDPGNVTIFGESAGADIVNHLMVAPAAAGLFHRAISQSSSVGLAPGVYLERGTPMQPSGYGAAEAFVARLALPAGGDTAAALRALDADALLAAYGPRDRFTPVIDGRFLPGQVGLLFRAGRQQRVPYLTGSNSWEASLGRNIGGSFSPAIAARLVPAGEQARMYPGLGGDALADAIFGDLVIVAPARHLAGEMRKAGVPVFRYHLSYVASALREKQPGVAHADDIAFVMGNLGAWGELDAVSDQDRKVSAMMMRYWVQFARSGDPNGEGLPTWLADVAGGRVLVIGERVERRDAWRDDVLAWHEGRGLALMERAAGLAEGEGFEPP